MSSQAVGGTGSPKLRNGSSSTWSYATTPVNVQDNGMQTPLLLAADNKQEKTVITLILKDPNPNLGDKNGFVPLFSAIRDGNETIYRYLIHAGADVHYRQGEFSPLYTAVINGRLNIAQHLIAEKADPTLTVEGKTLLTLAQERQLNEIEDFLLSLPHFQDLVLKREATPSLRFFNQGSQKSCNGEVNPSAVKELCEALNKTSPCPSEIQFKPEGKTIDSIEGGTCTAMTFDLAQRIADDPTRPHPEVFAEGERYADSNEEFRLKRLALNCIELVHDMDYETAEAKKMAAMAAFYSFSAERVGSPIFIPDIEAKALTDSLTALESGMYFIRIVKREKNVKLELHGHSMLLITYPSGWYFYDVNRGFTWAFPIPTDKHMGDLFSSFIKKAKERWDVDCLSLYNLKKLPQTLG